MFAAVVAAGALIVVAQSEPEATILFKDAADKFGVVTEDSDYPQHFAAYSISEAVDT